MNWTIALIIATAVAVFFIMKQTAQIPSKDAITHLKNGALVVDVRNPDEFNSGHIPTALNFPLDRIESDLPLHVKDKNQALLMHCQGGVRSRMAVQKAKGMGYANSFNLGSFDRAKQIIEEGASG